MAHEGVQRTSAAYAEVDGNIGTSLAELGGALNQSRTTARFTRNRNVDRVAQVAFFATDFTLACEGPGP